MTLAPPLSFHRAVRPSDGEVWCGKCEKPATKWLRLTTGESVARCSQHAWLLVAPRGQR